MGQENSTKMDYRSTNPSQTSTPIKLVENDQIEDVVCELDEYPPLLEGIKYVEAQCIKIEEKCFWGRRKGLEFTFKVTHPEEHEGQELAGLELHMFVKLGGWWEGKKRPRKSAKAAKISQVAGCPKGLRKSAFLDNIFRCQLRRTVDAFAPYTII